MGGGVSGGDERSHVFHLGSENPELGLDVVFFNFGSLEPGGGFGEGVFVGDGLGLELGNLGPLALDVLQLRLERVETNHEALLHLGRGPRLVLVTPELRGDSREDAAGDCPIAGQLLVLREHRRDELGLLL